MSSSASLQKAISGRQLHIPLNAKVPCEALKAKIYDHSNKFIKNAKIIKQQQDEYIIKFKPKEAGLYRMEILVNGEPKRTVEIMAEPAPVARLLGSSMMTTYVGQEAEFEIERPRTIKGEQIEGAFRRIDSDETYETVIKAISDTKTVVSFSPPAPGRYVAVIRFSGQAMMSGELTVDAVSLPSVTLLLDETAHGCVDMPYQWRLKYTNLPVKQLSISITSADGSEVRPRLVDHDGILDVIFTPTIPGPHTATLRLDSGEFSDKLQMHASPKDSPKRFTSPPFIAKINYHNEISIGSPFEVTLEVLHFSPTINTLLLLITNPLNTIHHEASPIPLPDDNRYHLSWTPPSPGQYTLQVYLDGAMKESLSFEVVEMDNPKAEYLDSDRAGTVGAPFRAGTVGTPFIINLTLDHKDVPIKAPIKNEEGEIVDYAEVDPNPTGEGPYLHRLIFIPKDPGVYTMSLIINNKLVDNSTTKFNIT